MESEFFVVDFFFMLFVDIASIVFGVLGFHVIFIFSFEFCFITSFLTSETKGRTERHRNG